MESIDYQKEQWMYGALRHEVFRLDRSFLRACLSCSEQYNLEYYLDFTRKLTELGIHVLAIKDMAGLLKPAAATMLVRHMHMCTGRSHCMYHARVFF